MPTEQGRHADSVIGSPHREYSDAITVTQEPTGRQFSDIDDRIAYCRGLFRSDGPLHYLAHCSPGSRDFDLYAPAGPGRDDDRLVENCRRVARRLSFQSGQVMHEWLRPLGQGVPLRTVLQSAGGAFYCARVVPGVLLVAGTLGLTTDEVASLARQPAVQEADSALSQLVDQIRAGIRLPRQNLGAWDTKHFRESAFDREAADIPRQQPASAPRPLPSIDSTTRRNLETSADPRHPLAITGDRRHWAFDACAAAVDGTGLHLVACFNDKVQLFSVDALGTPELRGAAYRHSPSYRRQQVNAMGPATAAYLRELGRTARPAIGGPAVRAVLDTDIGAIYYYRLSAREYVIGLCLDQDQVDIADNSLTEVVLAVCGPAAAAVQPLH
ncbi:MULTISPECIES: hypothetical protein [unclassified Micromonospora]|uniref:hypothetical protein n=1 Tax=unclassified Micromonospora TaxID=2617518 RepID=UPI003A83D5B2